MRRRPPDSTARGSSRLWRQQHALDKKASKLSQHSVTGESLLVVINVRHQGNRSPTCCHWNGSQPSGRVDLNLDLKVREMLSKRRVERSPAPFFRLSVHAPRRHGFLPAGDRCGHDLVLQFLRQAVGGLRGRAFQTERSVTNVFAGESRLMRRRKKIG